MKKARPKSRNLFADAQRNVQRRHALSDVYDAPAAAKATARAPERYSFSLSYRNGERGDRVSFDAVSFDDARKRAAQAFLSTPNAIGVTLKEHADHA
jgi:hypothetical protein